MNYKYNTFILLIVSLFIAQIGLASPFATQVVSSTNYDSSGLYNVPENVLGHPTTSVHDDWSNTTVNTSMVYGAFGPSAITTISQGQELIVTFDHDITDDPNNPFGLDFIVFGNTFFPGSGIVDDTIDMANYNIGTMTNGNGQRTSEGIIVSVSPDNDTWYTFTDGPWGDELFPTQANDWDRDNHTWGDLLDPTKPVDPSLTVSDFGGKTVADAIDLYDGSMGGTGFDLAASGFESIRFIKLTGFGGEVDAISDVAPIPEPATMILFGVGGLAMMKRKR